MNNITISEAVGVSLLGFGIVFVVLILLMCVIYAMAGIFKAAGSKTAVAAVPVSAPTDASAAQAAPALAKGSCGQVSLFDVPDKTAAMVMAVVADELGVPLNELRFISIREVEDNAK